MKKIINWIVDYRYMIHGSIISLLHHKAPAHYLGHIQEGKVPIILIPGILGRWSFLKDLGDKIPLEGHPVYIVPNLKYNLFSIPESARIVREMVDTVKKETPHFSNTIIIAHSKGGLIGKYFLIHYNKDKPVSSMISIATPYSGSAMANLVPLDPIRELRNDSTIIKDLNTHSHVNSIITSIIPEYDNHVWAEEGSYLQGATNIQVPVHGHHRIVFDKGVQKIILEQI